MRILVCGGRHYGDLVSLHGNRKHPHWPQREREYRNVCGVLYELSLKWPKTPEDEYGNWLPNVKIITGGATGADQVAIDWAIIHWCPYKEYKADWKKHGPAAGPLRNQQMLDEERPDLVVAFPGGKGTADMIRRAKKAGIEVIEVEEEVGQ